MSIDWVAVDIIAGAVIIGYAIYQAADLVSTKQLRNSPEYRKKYAACQEYVDYKSEFTRLLEQEYADHLTLNEKRGLSAGAKEHLNKAIKRSEQQRQKLNKDISDKYEGSLYNPFTLPFGEWPPELLAVSRSIDEESEAIRNKYIDLRHGTNLSKQETSMIGETK